MVKQSRTFPPAQVWPWVLEFDPDLEHKLGNRQTTMVQAWDLFLENVHADPLEAQVRENKPWWSDVQGGGRGGGSYNMLPFLWRRMQLLFRSFRCVSSLLEVQLGDGLMDEWGEHTLKCPLESDAASSVTPSLQRSLGLSFRENHSTSGIASVLKIDYIYCRK